MLLNLIKICRRYGTRYKQSLETKQDQEAGLYEPDNFAGSKPELVSKQVENILKKGGELEFRQKEYSKAIEYYRNALPAVTSMQGQGEIYNSIARVQKKLGRPEEAIKTYKTLLNSYTDVYIQGNIPLGMVALLESGFLYLEIHDTTHCLEALNSLLAQIKNSRWSINYPTYFNIVSKIKEIVALAENVGGKAMISAPVLKVPKKASMKGINTASPTRMRTR